MGFSAQRRQQLENNVRENHAKRKRKNAEIRKMVRLRRTRTIRKK
jgi:hypothetical protein